MNHRITAAFVLVLALQLAVAVWWIPQKWTACQSLYTSRPAQLFCLISSH